MTNRRRLIAIAVVFFLTALIIYSNVLNGDFVFDDFEYIVDNPLIRDVSHLTMSDPRQIGYLSFALNHATGGEDTLGYHLVNVAIHAANAFLVFLLVSAFFRIASNEQAFNENRFRTALLTAALFLVHPVSTQAVSYITQRFTSLTTLFYLAAIVLYMHARFLLEKKTSPDRAYFFYALSLAATVLAMRTKEISFTIPFMIAAIEIVLMRQSIFGRRRLMYPVPFAATLLIIPLSIFGPELGLISPGDGIVEITRQEKIFDFQNRSPYEYVLTQFRVIILYLRILLIPAGQSVVHDIRASRSIGEPAVMPSLLILLSLAWAGWYFWRRAQKAGDGTGPEYALTAAGIFWFFLTLSVESSFIPIKDLIFEHRVYLPGPGFFAVAAVGLGSAAGRLLRGLRDPRGPWLVFLVCLPLAVTTFVRNDVWTSEVKLWDDVIQKNPNKPIGYNNRGTAYAKARQYELALQDLDRTISFFPKSFTKLPEWEDSDLIPPNMSKTYLARGRIHLALGNVELAERDFKRAQQIFLPQIDIEEHLKAGDFYYKKGAFKHAIDEFGKVLEADPENIDALNNRGNAYSQTGRYDEAIRDFDLVIGLEPAFALAYHNRGIAFAWKNAKAQAVADFEKACLLGFQPACESIDTARSGGK